MYCTSIVCTLYLCTPYYEKFDILRLKSSDMLYKIFRMRSSCHDKYQAGKSIKFMSLMMKEKLHKYIFFKVNNIGKLT